MELFKDFWRLWKRDGGNWRCKEELWLFWRQYRWNQWEWIVKSRKAEDTCCYGDFNKKPPIKATVNNSQENKKVNKVLLYILTDIIKQIWLIYRGLKLIRDKMVLAQTRICARKWDKILWYLGIRMDHLFSARRPDLVNINTNKTQKTCRLLDFGVSANHRVKI